LGTDQNEEAGPVEPNAECERYAQAAVTLAVSGKVLEIDSEEVRQSNPAAYSD